MPDPCPSPESLLRVHEGLPEDAGIRRHVAQCATCQAAVRETTTLLAVVRLGLREAQATDDTLRRERLIARLRAEPRAVTASAPVPGEGWWWAWWRGWPLRITLGVTVAAIAWVVLARGPSLAAKTIDRAVQAEARMAAGRAQAGLPAPRVWIQVLPPNPAAPPVGCHPFQTPLPIDRSAVPAVATRLLEQFWARSDARLSPSQALGESYDAWSRGLARWARDERVQDDGPVRIVSLASPRGPLQRAELTVSRGTDRIERVSLLGAGCRVVITTVLHHESTVPAP